MKQNFYKRSLTERHGLEVLVPDDAGRAEVH
jgi:aspartate/glutamate racemase